MKYAFFFFFLSISNVLHARSITSFNDSNALLSVAVFMEDASEDLPQATFINDNKHSLDSSSCELVSAESIYNDVEKAVKKIARFYPDEDIPFFEALVDLEDYLDQRKYYKCQTIKNQSSIRLIKTFYVDLKNEVYLTVSNKIFL
jgi:hypothetical protein